ncbi:MAG: DUF2934 domain-containing protein [Candidatus Omnitrophota bacterium]
MKKQTNPATHYSKQDLTKIRKRAAEIWKRKCQALNTALDDWLQAERELKMQTGLKHKTADQYTSEEIAKIKSRAQAIRDEKVGSLRTAFDDWIEAEQELKEELLKKGKRHELFDMWFNRVLPRLDVLLEGEGSVRPSHVDQALGQEYVELMTECMR